MTPIDRERLDVAHAAAERLLNGLKPRGNLKGKELQRMRLVEKAVQALEAVRLV